jgi:hypothetical protein
MWTEHDRLTDEIIDILKQINAVNFYTPIGCVGKLIELSGKMPLHGNHMIPSLQANFEVNILFHIKHVTNKNKLYSLFSRN